MVGVFAFFLACLPGGPTLAQIQPSGEFLEMCLGEGAFAGDRQDKAEGVCWGFIAAIGEVMVAGNPVSGIVACPPMGERTVMRGDIIRIAKGHLRYRVKDPNLPASVAIAQALAIAFPCE